jgi:hypothetical protein
MNIKEIVGQYLKEAGYDGLYHTEEDGFPCACALQGLMECQEPTPHCQAGYITRCYCGEEDCAEAHDDYISSEKQ